MKKVFSSILMFAVVGLFSVSAQNFKYVVKSSADCTHLTTEFTVPAGKVAKIASLEITTSFTTCNASQSAPTSNFASIYLKPNLNSKSAASSVILYKKTVSNSGSVTESTPIQNVTLNAGTYILEVSKAPNLRAELEITLQ
jgi:hypothetical protein